jgi:membrane-bound lytic murein transglycosylase D
LNEPYPVIDGQELVPPGRSFLTIDSERTLGFGGREATTSAAEKAATLQKDEMETESRPGDSSLSLVSKRPNTEKEEESRNPAAKQPLKYAPSLSSSNHSDDSGYRGEGPFRQLEMEAILQALILKEKPAEELIPAGSLPSQMLSGIPTLLNERVKGFIDFFQNRADGFFTKSLARSQAYEGMMKQIFREKNLPEELFYLALIESGYNPQAESRAKALGIWQFMSKTAKRFGLKVDKWVDERRDPEKSTYAAAEYLKSLHEMFNCWYLATASYNAGEGKILQAMKRAKSQDFWEISQQRYLKRETKEYVPMFLAAMIIAQDPQKYGFSNIDYHLPLMYEKVAVPPGTRLDRIARAAETDLEKIRTLNPSLRKDRTPPEGPCFEVKIPPGKKEVFETNFSQMKIFDPRKSRKHDVRRGETLGQISKKYRIDLRELCEGNQITPKTPIKPGMTLLLPPK